MHIDFNTAVLGHVGELGHRRNFCGVLAALNLGDLRIQFRLSQATRWYGEGGGTWLVAARPPTCVSVFASESFVVARTAAANATVTMKGKWRDVFKGWRSGEGRGCSLTSGIKFGWSRQSTTHLRCGPVQCAPPSTFAAPHGDMRTAKKSAQSR